MAIFFPTLMSPIAAVKERFDAHEYTRYIILLSGHLTPTYVNHAVKFILSLLSYTTFHIASYSYLYASSYFKIFTYDCNYIAIQLHICYVYPATLA